MCYVAIKAVGVAGNKFVGKLFKFNLRYGLRMIYSIGINQQIIREHTWQIRFMFHLVINFI